MNNPFNNLKNTTSSAEDVAVPMKTEEVKAHFSALKHELTLTDEERMRMRTMLIARMDAPLSDARPIPSPFLLMFTRPNAAFALVLLLLVGGGSVSAAAGQALPGETLYPVKVSVNERVQRFAAFSTVAKANVEIEHAEERLREVELLTAKGDTDERALEEITSEVTMRVMRAGDTAQTLKEEGRTEEADRIETAITSALAAHADILEAQAEGEDDEGRKRLRALSVAVSIAAEDVSDSGIAEDSVRDDNVLARLAEAREEAIHTRVDAIRKELEKDNIAIETEQELLDELAAIEAEFADARVMLREENYEDAVREYGEIAQRAYRAEALLTSARRITTETGKEVFIRIDVDSGARGKQQGDAADASATMMFMITNEEDTQREAPELEFRVGEVEESN